MNNLVHVQVHQNFLCLGAISQRPTFKATADSTRRLPTALFRFCKTTGLSIPALVKRIAYGLSKKRVAFVK